MIFFSFSKRFWNHFWTSSYTFSNIWLIFSTLNVKNALILSKRNFWGRRLPRKLFESIIFSDCAEILRLAAENVQVVCQNCSLSFYSLRETLYGKKTIIFPVLIKMLLVYPRQTFRLVVQTEPYLSLRFFWGKRFSLKHFCFSTSLQILSAQPNFRLKFLLGFGQFHFTCPVGLFLAECFPRKLLILYILWKFNLRKYVFHKNSIFLSNSDFEENLFGLWRKPFRTLETKLSQGCQNCILRVQRNILRRLFFRKKISLSKFFGFLTRFWVFRQY